MQKYFNNQNQTIFAVSNFGNTPTVEQQKPIGPVFPVSLNIRRLIGTRLYPILPDLPR